MVPETGTSQVTFSLLKPLLSVFVKQLLLAVLLLASRRTDAKTTIAAKETSSCLPSFFFFTDSSYQTKVWAYQEGRVCHLACTDAASSDEQSRCCLACGFLTYKLG